MNDLLSDKLPFALFLAAVTFLVFLAGVLMTIAGVYPTEHIRDAYRAGVALYQKSTQQLDPLTTDLWAPARTEARGVTVHERERVQPGFTLYTSGDGPRAMLIDLDGRVVHEWQRPFSMVWDDSAAVRAPVPDSQTYFRRAHVYPNGDLLTIYIGVGDSPWGYGMARLDSESNLLWKNLDQFHHDFTVAEDGRIFGLTHAFRTEPLEGADQFQGPFLDDYLTVVSPEGETLKKISLLDAVNRSAYRRLLWRVAYYSMEDPLHTNAVDVLTEADARQLVRKLPMARAGQVLLSFRELSGGSLALLEPDTGEIVWASSGAWMAQHDPDVLPNGNLLIFDNRGNYGDGGDSRVIEVDPGTGAVLWIYAGTAERPFESRIRSAQQRLPNGNTLITESDGGRLLEVTPQREIVWEFVNPVRGGEKDERIPVVSWGERIDPLRLAADFRARFSTQFAAREVSNP